MSAAATHEPSRSYRDVPRNRHVAGLLLADRRSPDETARAGVRAVPTPATSSGPTRTRWLLSGRTNTPRASSETVMAGHARDHGGALTAPLGDLPGDRCHERDHAGPGQKRDPHPDGAVVVLEPEELREQETRAVQGHPRGRTEVAAPRSA